MQSTQFQSLHLKTKEFDVQMDVFTPSTYIMVISSDQTICKFFSSLLFLSFLFFFLFSLDVFTSSTYIMVISSKRSVSFFLLFFSPQMGVFTPSTYSMVVSSDQTISKLFSFLFSSNSKKDHRIFFFFPFCSPSCLFVF